jgi:hypothetical protein
MRRVLLAMVAVVALLATGCGPDEGRDLSDFAAGAGMLPSRR